MYKLQHFFTVVTLMLYCLAKLVIADEVLVQMNLKRPISVVSDEFVSFSIDPNVLLDSINGTDSEITDFMAAQLSPAFLKISGNSFFTLTSALSGNSMVHGSKEYITKAVWKNFNDWIRSVGWKPVIPLPYSPKNWDVRETLHILNVSKSLGVKNCIWQLGLDFDAVGAANYVADLTTLQTMVDGFSMYTKSWGIVGADISAGSNPEETRLYTELGRHIVEAVGWMQPSDQLTFDSHNNLLHEKDMALRAILNGNLPSWLSLSAIINKNYTSNICSTLCVIEGLQWAKTLGDAARTGFDVVFKPLNKADICEPGFNYYVSLLFKKIMGQKVFEVKMINGDRFVSHAYAHCTKNRPGGLTIMAVNMADVKTKILTQMTGKFTGSEMWQYILTVQNGMVMLNGEPIYLNTTFDPFVKIKHPNRPITLSLPPMSIGFWILPLANLRECYTKGNLPENQPIVENESRKSVRMRSSTDLLLEQLISENSFTKTQTDAQKLKRHTVVKKDSNYLKQQLQPNNQHYDCSNSVNPGLSRQKRFILKHKRTGILQNIFDGTKSGDYHDEKENRGRFRKSFPVVPIRRLEEILKHNPRRYKRQVLNSRRQPVLRRIPIMPGVDSPDINEKKPIEIPEENIFLKRENDKIPKGDVEIPVGPPGDYDYVEFPETTSGKNITTSEENIKNSYPITKIISLKEIQKDFEVNSKKSSVNDNKKTSPLEKKALSDTINFGLGSQHQPLSKKTEKMLDTKTHHQSNPFNEQLIDPFSLVKPKPVPYKNFMDVSYESDVLGVRPNYKYNPTLQNGQQHIGYRMKRNIKNSISPKNSINYNIHEKLLPRKRNRRNSLIKSYSWSLSRDANMIPKLSSSESSYSKYLPYIITDDFTRSVRPIDVNNIQGYNVDNVKKTNIAPSLNVFSMDDSIQSEDNTIIPETNDDNDGSSSNNSPKFMDLISEKVLNFMDMINHHVSGWWNTWS